MDQYIYTAKSGVHVINLEETDKALKDAVDFIKEVTASGKKIVFVGTKKQASIIVKKAAENCGMPFVAFRWLGGTFTNFEAIKESIRKFIKNKEILEKGDDSMTKREMSKLREEVEKGERTLGGLIDVEELPGAMILIGVHDETNAAREAKVAHIPTIGLVDTNTDPKSIDYPIPANDDATKSIELFANLFSAVIKENKTLAAKKEDKSIKE